MARERIGILDGTFDPIHQGHIQMALSALEAARLNRLYIIPAGDAGYKPCIVSGEDRWKMVVAACSQDGRLLPSRQELDSPVPSFTVDTLLALRKKHPRAELFVLLGTDGLMKLHGWRRLEEVLPLCSFLVCPRVGDTRLQAYLREKARLTGMGARIFMITMRPVSVSSTEVRDRLAHDSPAPNLYGPVREFCALLGLYGMPVREERARPWIERLFASVTPHRFAHSLSVAAESRRLAERFGLDARRAEQAGLLHDCAKCLPLEEMRRIAVDNSLTDDEAMLSSGALLHSVVGAFVARRDYGMEDPEVLEAIAYHNTGCAGMSRLAMCVCLADSIEPTRDSYPLLEQVRALAEKSLEGALLLSLEGTASFVRSRGKYLHPRTQETIAWLKTLPEARSGINQ